jgi:hypothetical protein
LAAMVIEMVEHHGAQDVEARQCEHFARAGGKAPWSVRRLVVPALRISPDRARQRSHSRAPRHDQMGAKPSPRHRPVAASRAGRAAHRVRFSSSPRGVDDSPRQANDSPREANGSPRQADGSPLEADDSPRQADDSPRQADGSPLEADGSPRQADGSPRQANGSPRQADGSPRQADGSPRQADGSPPGADRPPRGASGARMKDPRRYELGPPKVVAVVERHA